MNDIILFTNFKGSTNINTKPDNILLRKLRIGNKAVKRSKEFHTDKDIPSYFSFAFNDLIILNTNNVFCAFEIIHKSNLIKKIIHKSTEIIINLFIIHSLGSCKLNLLLVFRNSENFNSRIKCSTIFNSFSTIYLAKRAFA